MENVPATQSKAGCAACPRGLCLWARPGGFSPSRLSHERFRSLVPVAPSCAWPVSRAVPRAGMIILLCQHLARGNRAAGAAALGPGMLHLLGGESWLLREAIVSAS